MTLVLLLLNRIAADGTCTGVQIEQTAEFNVSVSLTDCNTMNFGQVIEYVIHNCLLEYIYLLSIMKTAQ